MTSTRRVLFYNDISDNPPLGNTCLFAEFEFPRRHQVYHKEKPFKVAQSAGKRDQNP
jgi:hypothetical protein